MKPVRYRICAEPAGRVRYKNIRENRALLKLGKASRSRTAFYQVAQKKGIPFCHWVVFVRDNGKSFVLDPKASLKNNKRTDFGMMKPRWYIEVDK